MLLWLCPKYTLQVTVNLCQCKDGLCQGVRTILSLQEQMKLSRHECIALQGFGEVLFQALCSHIPSLEQI